MSANIKLTYDGKEVADGQKALRKGNEEIEASYSDIAKEVAATEKKQVQSAQRIIKSQRTEKEILGQKIKDLRTLADVDQSQKSASAKAIRTLIAEERKRLASIEDNKTKSTEAYKSEQRLIREGVKETGRLVEANKSLAQKHRELKTAIDAAHDAGKIGSDEHRAALKELDKQQDQVRQGAPFGGKALSDLKSYVAGIATIGTAISGVRAVFQDLKKDRDDALGIGDSLKEARTSLRGLSTDFDELERKADEISLETGVDRITSRQLLFTGTSQKLEPEDVKLVAELDPVIRSDFGIQFAADLKDLFSKEALTAEQSLATALSAADASKLNPAEFLPQLQKASIGAAVQGASSSDTASIVGALATIFSERTGTNVKTLLTKFSGSEQFAGLDAIESIEKASQLSVEDRKAFINGNAELKGTLQVAIDSLARIQQFDAAIEREQNRAGTDDSIVRKEIREAFDLTRQSGRLLTGQRSLNRARVASEIGLEDRVAIDAGRRETERLSDELRIKSEANSQIGGSIAASVNEFFVSGGRTLVDLGLAKDPQGEKLLEESKVQTEAAKISHQIQERNARASEATAEAMGQISRTLVAESL